jgi:hypothetical protein
MYFGRLNCCCHPERVSHQKPRLASTLSTLRYFSSKIYHKHVRGSCTLSQWYSSFRIGYPLAILQLSNFNTSIESVSAFPVTMSSSKMSIDSLLNPTRGHCKSSSCDCPCYHASGIGAFHSKYKSCGSDAPPKNQPDCVDGLRVAGKCPIWPMVRCDRAIDRTHRTNGLCKKEPYRCPVNSCQAERLCTLRSWAQGSFMQVWGGRADLPSDYYWSAYRHLN